MSGTVGLMRTVEWKALFADFYWRVKWASRLFWGAGNIFYGVGMVEVRVAAAALGKKKKKKKKEGGGGGEGGGSGWWGVGGGVELKKCFIPHVP